MKHNSSTGENSLKLQSGALPQEEQAFAAEISKKNNDKAQGVREGGSKGINPLAVTAICASALALFIGAVFAVMLALNGIYPFGEYTMSSYDMLAQVAPYIEHFFDVIDGKSSLFYSYAIAGGADLFGTLAYCCVSPFTFIFLLFGKGNVYYGTAIVLPLKIISVAIAGLIYLRKRFKHLPPAVSTVLALCYAYCGYLFVSNTYINWVDLLIYLPFVALGFGKIVQTGKKATFITALSLMIYTCFSISCFSLFLVYPIAVLYCVTVVRKEARRRVLFDLVMALATTVFVCLPILLPSLAAFLVSGRRGGLFENLMAEFSAEPLYKKVSYIFTDSLTLFFTLLYFLKNGVKRPIDRFLFITFFVLLVPVLCDEACNLLNFGSYMSYSLRFGFLNGFYFFFVAALFLNGEFKQLSDQRKALLEGEASVIDAAKPMSGKARSLKMPYVAIIALAVAGAFVGGYFLFGGLVTESFTKSFAARFAHSLGGLEATAIICAIVAIIALLAVVFVKYKKISVKIAVFTLLIVTCGQTAFYSYFLVYGNRSHPENFQQMKVLVDYVHELENSDDVRIKTSGDYITADMPFTLHTNAYTVFSSVTDARNFKPTTFFGYGGNGKNTIKSYNGTFFGDCLLGYRYQITKGAPGRDYLMEVDGYDKRVDQSGTVLDVGEYMLYKSQYAYPHALIVPNAKSPFEGERKRAVYDRLLKMLGGDGAGVIDLTGDQLMIDKYDDGDASLKNVYKIKVKLVRPGNYFLDTSFALDGKLKYSQSIYNEENGRDIPEDGVISLGYVNRATSSTPRYYYVYISVPQSVTLEQFKQSVSAFCVSNEDVIDIYQSSQSRNVEFSAEAGSIKVSAEASAGEYLFLNYISLPGHSATVNGKSVQLLENDLGFILLPLEEGMNDVVVSYRSPYVKLIVYGLIGALLYLVAYYFLIIKSKKTQKILAGPVAACAIGLAVAITLFFMVMPIVVFVVKNAVMLVNKLIALF